MKASEVNRRVERAATKLAQLSAITRVRADDEQRDVNNGGSCDELLARIEAAAESLEASVAQLSQAMAV